jgi:hypothetical protein
MCPPVYFNTNKWLYIYMYLVCVWDAIFPLSYLFGVFDIRNQILEVGGSRYLIGVEFVVSGLCNGSHTPDTFELT